jgi:prepilin peptidase CpaA
MDALGVEVWAYAVLAVVLIVAAVTDVRSGKIYNWTTYPAMLIGLIGHGVIGGFWGEVSGPERASSLGLAGSLAGLLVGFAPLGLAWLAGGIGGGDAKIMAAVGALVGWRFALTSLLYGLGVAVLMAAVILLRRRIARDTLGRVGRFVWLWLMKARPQSPATETSPTLPFGFALCVGSAVALTLTLLFGPQDALLLAGL